ncbi:MAG: prepilin-type N-terminal cleavage/methylation domain-containing protein [Candidatus Omnitrophica bacterium]|nr:prepilin-type N-terminal cleavage/methylation domain-containing protein [Candidatus Omnitrophota bacterium]
MERTPRCTRGFTLFEIIIVVFILVILITLAVPEFETSQRLADVAEAQQGLQAVATGIFAYKDSVDSGGVFPPAGGVAQMNWVAWNDDSTFTPNGPNNNFHACSVLWVNGSFYANRGDDSELYAASRPSGIVHYDLRVLTSPVEALLDIPRDPFKNDGESLNAQFDYFGLNLSEEFVLRSVGPDGVSDAGCGFGGFNCPCAESQCLQLGTGVANRRVFNAASDSQFGCSGCTTLEEALTFGNIVYSPTNGVASLGDLFQLSSEGNPGVTSVEEWQLY